MTARAIYLGDGAYATLEDDGDLMLTIGSHLRNDAESAMWINPPGIKKLLSFLENPMLGDEVQLLRRPPEYVWRRDCDRCLLFRIMP